MTAGDPDLRWRQRYGNYAASLANLEQAGELFRSKSLNVVEQAGFIQLFELTWELGWKLLRDRMVASGLTEGIASPAGAIRAAFDQGLVEDGQAWMDAGKLRNTLSHEYHPDRAADALARIADHYIPLFAALDRRLASHDQ